jgi:hypothetical protein
VPERSAQKFYSQILMDPKLLGKFGFSYNLTVSATAAKAHHRAHDPGT